MSRSSVRRALTLLAATPVAAAALLGTGPAASAVTNPPVSCDPAVSTKLLEGTVNGGFRYLYVEQRTDRTLVCAGNYPTNVVVEIKPAVGVTVPTVTRVDGLGSCATELLDLTAPAVIEVSYGVTTAPTLCIGLNDEWTTLGLTGASVNTLPDVNVYRSGNPSFVTAFCATEYFFYVQSGQVQYSPQYYAYYNCRDNYDQLL
ncbi:MAG TPA: hypothetical protein VF519_05425 [Mycobacteriales bacterium]|jgi:hypothetical protein